MSAFGYAPTPRGAFQLAADAALDAGLSVTELRQALDRAYRRHSEARHIAGCAPCRSAKALDFPPDDTPAHVIDLSAQRSDEYARALCGAIGTFSRNDGVSGDAMPLTDTRLAAAIDQGRICANCVAAMRAFARGSDCADWGDEAFHRARERILR